MNSTKAMNQHYVPKAYLKNFATKKGKEFFVDVYDKKEDRYFKTNIKNICSEVDFYTLTEGNAVAEDLFTIEKIYSNGIEPLYLKAYQIFTNNNVRWISPHQRAEILLGVLQFYLRNPRILNRAIAVHKKEITRLYEEAFEKGAKGMSYLSEDFSFREWTKEAIIEFFENLTTKEYKEKHVIGIGELGNFHEDTIFEVSMINDESEFITSDNPLVTHDYITDVEDPMLRSKEFMIPLNKKFALKLYHDRRKNKHMVYRHFLPNGSVAMLNQQIVEQCSRFVIANKEMLDNHFKFCRDFLDNTSVSLKIDSIRQILEKFPSTPDNKTAHDILRFYLNKHENSGGLTPLDEHEMTLKLKAISSDFLKKKVL